MPIYLTTTTKKVPLQVQARVIQRLFKLSKATDKYLYKKAFAYTQFGTGFRGGATEVEWTSIFGKAANLPTRSNNYIHRHLYTHATHGHTYKQTIR